MLPDTPTIPQLSPLDKSIRSIIESFDKIAQLHSRTLSLSSFKNNSINHSLSHSAGIVLSEPADDSPAGTITGFIKRSVPSRQDTGIGKRLLAFEQNVIEFVKARGASNVGFLTLTFKDSPDWKVASSRWNSFNSNFFSQLDYVNGWILVREYQKRGSIHFHLLVDFGTDIRTGFDFYAVERRDYRSASAFLRGVWSDFRNACPKYGFGRSEILPLKGPHPEKPILPGDSEKVGILIGKYVSKYLRKSFKVVSEFRSEEKLKTPKLRKEWHGRYIAYSAGARMWSSSFQQCLGPGIWWRQRVHSFVEALADLGGVEDSWEGMTSLLGKCWVFQWGETIASMRPGRFFENCETICRDLALDPEMDMRLVWRSGGSFRVWVLEQGEMQRLAA